MPNHRVKPMEPVLFVSASAPMGGAEVYLLELARGLKGRGRAISVIAPPGSAVATRVVGAGIELIPWPPGLDQLVRRGRGNRWLSRAKGLLAQSAAHQWVAAVQSNRGAILHLNSTRAAFLAADRSRGIVEVKDALGPPFMSRVTGRLISYRMARSARVAVANSQFIADRMRAYGYPMERVQVIRNGLDLGRVRPALKDERLKTRSEEGWSDSWVVLALVGRITAWKGQIVAVEALARVSETVPGARLVLIGDTGFDGTAYLDRVRRLASDLGVRDRVIEVGYRDDASRLMSATDVILHTSIYPEPLGLTPMEAQALGIPVVASAGGGTLETVAHKHSGYLYPAGNVAELSAGILWALDAATDERFRERIRLNAESNFALDDALDAYDLVYASLS
jgi:glycosyltransferase involved in cell wall biosynthesis